MYQLPKGERIQYEDLEVGMEVVVQTIEMIDLAAGAGVRRGIVERYNKLVLTVGGLVVFPFDNFWEVITVLRDSKDDRCGGY